MFASHRERAGAGSLELDLPAGATADQLYRSLEERFPGLAPLRAYTSFAVNRRICDSTTSLRDGDEVALIQPVSGGAND